MKHILLLMIRLYWFCKPKGRKPKCIFSTSCSHYVYTTTQQQGFLEGIKALKFRFKNCRYGFEIFKNPINNNIQMLLPSKIVLESKEIAERLIETQNQLRKIPTSKTYSKSNFKEKTET
jgi:uncharacterized protein